MNLEVSNFYLILFKQINGIGNGYLFKIYEKFKNFQLAYNSPLEDFKDIIKNRNILDNIDQFKNKKDDVINKVKEIDKILKKSHIRFISFYEDDFPPSLREIEDPPIGIYIKGELSLNKLDKSISIVGTRDPSLYGHIKARSIARDLALKNFVIVSGLARGIDLEAHIGALEGGGKTIAVLASGINMIYPPEHRNIAREIIRNGAIISEIYVDQKTSKHQLIKRNRMTSGLSKASLIIEGDLNSGTRHEASFAFEQKKTIFALKPNDIKKKVSKLPISLIEEGAIEIKNSSDILNYFS